MKKLLWMWGGTIVSFVVLTSSSTHQNPIVIHTSSPSVKTGTSASFASPSVKWNHHIYQITSDDNAMVDKVIGEIKSYSTNEQFETPDNSSNYFKEGTKIWRIEGRDTSEVIALEYEEGKYVIALAPSL